ncbi:MAG: DUF4442 domain-containing protein [Moheibacter sp.]
MTRAQFNKILLFKLPIAKIAGLRLHHFDGNEASISVTYGWLNQNPFRSMFWAVQGMAAELSTGILCIDKIQKSGQKVSMLVVGLEANFTKKAIGKIIFTCEQGIELDSVLAKAVETGEGQTLKMRSIGTDEKGDQVSEFFFTWSFKVKR